MPRAFISVGSNIAPDENVKKAVQLLRIEVRVRGVSTVYLTDPIGRPGQSSYYNCVLEIETPQRPLELKHLLRKIETILGRTRSSDKFASRTIDLDLLLYDDLIMNEEGLSLPDPDILLRPFLALALYELEPDLIMPDSKEPLARIVAGLGNSSLRPLTEYSARLKKEIAYEHREG